MQRFSKNELYAEFLGFLAKEMQRERYSVNRRVFSVLFWCILLPVMIFSVLFLFVLLGWIPFFIRSYLGWIILLFPILYTMRFLGLGFLKELPKIFKKNGGSVLLGQMQEKGKWRVSVCDELQTKLGLRGFEWRWLKINFEKDLDQMQARSRYLTVLVGAVLFLMIGVLDSVGRQDAPADFLSSAESFYLWFQSIGGDLQQFIGLVLFLVLFYLSDSQMQQFLRRYLDCLELLSIESEQKVAVGSEQH
jgi:hypothetical protein